MLDIYRIRTRIGEIRNRLVELDKNFKGLAKEEFLKDGELNAAAERHLQVAIQACIDIANHIASTLALRQEGKETAEVFKALGKENIISMNFVQTMVSMTGYRNILVHGYTEINPEKTYEYIRNGLPDFSQFAQYIEEFLEKQEKKAKPDTSE